MRNAGLVAAALLPGSGFEIWCLGFGVQGEELGLCLLLFLFFLPLLLLLLLLLLLRVRLRGRLGGGGEGGVRRDGDAVRAP